MMLAIRQCWVLFLGLALIMFGNGLQGTLVGVRSEIAGFSSMVTGFVMGGYFLGIFIGSFLIPRMIEAVGHVRIFGGLASLSSLAILAFPLLVDPIWWMFLRVIIGFSFGGLYIVCESWLNDRATNESRGQVLSIYTLINLIGLSGGQLLLNVYDPADFQLFSLVSVLVSLAVVPVLITATPVPNFEAPERMGVKDLYKLTPLGPTVIFFVGIAVGVLFSLGGPYMLQSGYSVAQASIFMALIMAGGMFLTWPIGKLSDMMDRRYVMLGSALLTGIMSFLGIFIPAGSSALYPLAIGLGMGMFMWPIYSLAMAHTNDFMRPAQMVSASSTLLLLHAAGAVLGANLAGFVMDLFGTWSFFGILSFSNFAIALYTIYRLNVRKGLPLQRGRFVAMFMRSSSIATQLHPEAEWVYESDTDENDEPVANRVNEE